MKIKNNSKNDRRNTGHSPSRRSASGLYVPYCCFCTNCTSGALWSSGYPRISLFIALIAEFEFHRGETVNFQKEKRKRDQLLKAWVGAIRRESTREKRAEALSL